MRKSRFIASLLVAPFLWASATGVAAVAAGATGTGTSQYANLQVVQSSAPEMTTFPWDTDALADFGFGVARYHADATVPAQLQIGERSGRLTVYLAGVVYSRVDTVGQPAEGPDYFTILDGTFTNQWVVDPDDQTWGHGLGRWNFTIETDAGAVYQCTGMILDFNRTEDRDVQHYVGPVIEP